MVSQPMVGQPVSYIQAQPGQPAVSYGYPMQPMSHAPTQPYPGATSTYPSSQPPGAQTNMTYSTAAPQNYANPTYGSASPNAPMPGPMQSNASYMQSNDPAHQKDSMPPPYSS